MTRRATRLVRDIERYAGRSNNKGKPYGKSCRTYLAIIAGVVAGILGLTGISGFLCYIFVMALGAVGLFIKTGFHINKYFDTWQRIGGMDGLTQGAMSFVLFWT
ncbi:unnamed protein product, partial [Closterium sp. NIES-54]